MRTPLIASLLLFAFTLAPLDAKPTVQFSGHRKLNNVASDLLVVADISPPGITVPFEADRDGWLFFSAKLQGNGTANVSLDDGPRGAPVLSYRPNDANPAEGMRRVSKGAHELRVDCRGDLRIERLVVREIPELMHCGLGFDPAIKGYGHYDLPFLQKDILPNVTTLVVPGSISLPRSVIENWHRQGKKFVAEVGVKSRAKTAEEHVQTWTAPFEKAPFLDGILINEFIVNQPFDSRRSRGVISPDRVQRIKREQQHYHLYEEALQRIHGDPRFRDKMIYGYVGGSGKKLNQEIIGKTFIRTILSCDYRVALERYLFERSSEAKSRQSLSEFVDGLNDWEAKEPGLKKNLVIAFGLFSMPPGGINKQPNVDYHVWMDEQMNVVANDPSLDGVGGFEWWTSILADEETVRFVGKLYRHYAIDGRKDRLTHDPLFLSHIENADFEKGFAGWTLQPADATSIAAKSFPRYGRIEGRYMGLGRPADPEHIGDTFLWMKRSQRAPNAFSQTIKNLEPGRLHSMKMFTCDYQDLVHPKKRTEQEANKFIGTVELEGVDLDTKRSFTEAYPSGPEPAIPVWITYHWKVFRAKSPTAKLKISDWPADPKTALAFGQEQTFNFIEIEPYHE